jgi:hypothetical protein
MVVSRSGTAMEKMEIGGLYSEKAQRESITRQALSWNS